LPFDAVAERTDGVATTVAIVSVAVAAIGLLVAWLLPLPVPIKSVVAGGSLALAISGSLPLAFKGEVNLKGQFTCGAGGCLKIERVGAAQVLAAMAPTPSFDIGSPTAGAKVRGCIAQRLGNDAQAWSEWRAAFRRDWLGRKDASAHDVVLLSGSADRQPLSAELRMRHESNSGLALARAEHVAEMLRQELGAAELPPLHRLNANRILIVATGPAGTGAPPAESTAASPCDDQARANQRRVSVWLQAARR
jgi:hypothetical protein